MVKFVEQTEAPYYLLLTECAMADNIAATHPDKHLLRIYRERCPTWNE
jgi:quinolinate synthase